MTPLDRVPATVIPIAALAVLAAGAVLPLQWATALVAAIALGALLGETIRRTVRSTVTPATVAASLALSATGGFIVGYAVYELTHRGAFGGGRLAYPFLIATGLRLDGGAWLLMLCAIAAIVPAMFRDKTPG